MARRPKLPPMMTKAESDARIALLRKRGYRVKKIRLPNGDVVVLKSKKRFVCSAAGCIDMGKKPTRRRKAAKRKRTRARRRRR